MKYYLAPLEGITGYIYRNAYHSYFKKADKYFTPFIAPNQKGKFSTRELNDILPEHNEGMYVVPQILTNKSADFIRTARTLKEYGYGEVNLNLGCPSRTVVSKYRGAGFLSKLDELDRFFDEVFSELDMKVSVKTRIGRYAPDEFNEILAVYNKYPMEELIIHPRVQQDYYKNKPDWEVFRQAVADSTNILCYNGDIFTVKEFKRFNLTFPSVNAVMLGRGILRNPGLTAQIEGGSAPDKMQVRKFHDRLFEDYQRAIPGERNVLFKMKELWFYLGELFTNSSSYVKKIKKAQHFDRYVEAVDQLFIEQKILGE